jgi:hypothetical protein
VTLAARPSCVGCTRPVDLDHPAVLREVVGFHKDRGDAGGQNHVRFRRETGRFLCGDCATRWKYGGNLEQGTLL